MNLTHYMLPAHATVFLATIPYVLGIIVASYVAKRAFRKSTTTDDKDSVWRKLKTALVTLTVLYVVAVVCFTIPNFSGSSVMLMAVAICTGLVAGSSISAGLEMRDSEKFRKNSNIYMMNVFMVSAVLMLVTTFVIAVCSSRESTGQTNTPVSEKVNGQAVEYRRALEPASDGKYLTINAIKQNNGIPRTPRIETITYYTWLERDTDNSIKTVTVNVGEKGGVTIVDDLPADEAPYVNYTPMYYPSSVDADGSNLCVAGRDKDCDLNATYAYDKATVHIPTGSTSNLVVTNREAKH